jgi:hypothetical protein
VRPVPSLTVMFSHFCCSSSNTLLTASEAVAQENEIAPVELLAPIVNTILVPLFCPEHSTPYGASAMGPTAVTEFCECGRRSEVSNFPVVVGSRFDLSQHRVYCDAPKVIKMMRLIAER